VIDGRDLSRRKLLWAVATVGAAASAGSGTATFLHDSEVTESTMTAGMLDLDTDPSWGNDSATGPFGGGTASKGDSGRETVTLSVSDNPSYLWFRTRCAQCEPVEEALFVRFGVDTDTDGTVDQWLSDGYLSLREARERYGDGVNLGEIGATDTWEFVVEWELREALPEDTAAGFDFGFYAAQSRHVMNTSDVAPDWACPGECDGTGDPGGGPDGLAAISWVAFCTPTPINEDDIQFTVSDDGRTLAFDSLPDEVETILLKYGTSLDVFDAPQSSVTVGDGTTYTQEGTSYPGTDPLRTNATPCPDSYGCKYEFSDDGGSWECKAPSTQTVEDNGNENDGGGSSHQSIRSSSIDALTGGED
jgi:hypothetical protein